MEEKGNSLTKGHLRSHRSFCEVILKFSGKIKALKLLLKRSSIHQLRFLVRLVYMITTKKIEISLETKKKLRTFEKEVRAISDHFPSVLTSKKEVLLELLLVLTSVIKHFIIPLFTKRAQKKIVSSKIIASGEEAEELWPEKESRGVRGADEEVTYSSSESLQEEISEAEEGQYEEEELDEGAEESSKLFFGQSDYCDESSKTCYEKGGNTPN